MLCSCAIEIGLEVLTNVFCTQHRKRCTMPVPDFDMSGSPCWEWWGPHCLTCLQTTLCFGPGGHYILGLPRSRAGKRAGFSGKTPALFWAWCRIHRDQKTALLIHENASTLQASACKAWLLDLWCRSRQTHSERWWVSPTPWSGKPWNLTTQCIF